MASKRHDRRRRCTGKKRYDDVRQAEADAASLRRRDRVAVTAYRCPHCGGIHVGHTPNHAVPSPTLGSAMP